MQLGREVAVDPSCGAIRDPQAHLRSVLTEIIVRVADQERIELTLH
jgi:hypothetical protein